MRILDLGCGAGQGYQLITKIDQRDLDLGLNHQRVLDTHDIGAYIGIDLSESMISRGNELYADDPAVHFLQGDLNDGLATVAGEDPFDLYFCAYGSLSHLETRSLESLLLEIAHEAADGSLIVMDLLGRNSLEWPTYWTAQTDAEKYRDYSMSYLYRDVNNQIPPGVEIEHFPMRFWTGDEIDSLVKSLNEQIADSPNSEAHTILNLRKKFDRSMFVGRHIDTGEYNANLKPIRRVVNRLHEDYIRTDIDQLFWEPRLVPAHPDARVNAFFEQLMTSWNILLDFFQERLQSKISLANIKGWEEFSGPLQFAMMTVDRVINSSEWMWYGDPRANIIEPQLGYALRSLEHNLQQGLGCGHGLVVVLEVQKQ